MTTIQVQEFCPTYHIPKKRKWFCETLGCYISSKSEQLGDLDYITLKAIHSELTNEIIMVKEAEDADAKARRRHIKSIYVYVQGLLSKARHEYNSTRDARYQCLRDVCIQYLEPRLAQKLIKKADQRWSG